MSTSENHHRIHSTVMDGFPQDYEGKMETFDTYNESMVTAANHQCDMVQSVNSSQAPAQQEMQVPSQESHDPLMLQQQQQKQQQQQVEQAHQVTQIESNVGERKMIPVRLPALLDGEYFAVTRVEDTNVTVVCQQCKKQLNGNLKSTGNFLSHVKRLHPALMSKIRCKSSQRKAAIYVNSVSTTPDKSLEIVREKRLVPPSNPKKRCKVEECTIGNEESYEQSADWNDTSLIRGSEESDPSPDPSLRISHNNSFMMEDEFDAIGRNVAAKLRNMRLDQRIIAEKLLNDILFEAQLGNLHRNSSIHV
ncbi:uncharacterized protein LOC105830277 [Monomorium pharaonis]|uniref:uncharacterized protein LOC105830277 n=1 Tax=Monomorium pharaonis TaxID=307658 RepID=UPI00063FB9FF|nr:uncharacterized protein LOC105830277 [Monomorium pharaonis]XP_012524962.1 uncharacterized protein LOC105830277 [Monomorium pharaonis]XP_012524971.1 uncharacterized protein LOC105830277 [Monomorium pharaonis]